MSRKIKSDQPDNLKRSFFRATVKAVLMFGANAWALNKTLESKLDGIYTRMLRATLNIFWRPHPTKLQLYGPIPYVNVECALQDTAADQSNELTSDLMLWTPR